MSHIGPSAFERDDNVPPTIGYNPDHDARQHLMAQGARHRRKKLILCFDGTGNKFKGNSGDSNILKIFRMLDRTSGDQSGIGTYITSSSLSHTSLPARFNSWLQKAMDSAVGTSFDQHVIGGYKFLMRYYSPGDEMYFFGFSRGAYTARFLAEMLDYVGLVMQGNEEMVFFAWKTFSQWQQRHGRDKKHQEKKRELFKYMKAFRETFTRPVSRIRFLGLFDTVNSVPRFEAAWMQRNKFPYTARSTAKVIRHAVAIDERRAKFRQDLISQEGRRHAKAAAARSRQDHHLSHGHGDFYRPQRKSMAVLRGDHLALPPAVPGMIQEDTAWNNGSVQFAQVNYADEDDCEREAASMRYRARSRSHVRPSIENATSIRDFASNPSASDISINLIQNEEKLDTNDESDDGEQDIEELWFPGGHADIGGGWDMEPNEVSLSHNPLVWMVREAAKAGLDFDLDKMREMNCWEEEIVELEKRKPSHASLPQIQISDSNGEKEKNESESCVNGNGHVPTQNNSSTFKKTLYEAAATGKVHDCLSFGQGLSVGSVISWKFMEYLPFKRMDLQPDGSWKPIRFPLPRGEVRDIPDDVKIHNSVLRRMETNPNYRPGNLIVGGGGRGVRIAPEKYGMGEWVVIKESGDPVGEALMKKSALEKRSEVEKSV